VEKLPPLTPSGRQISGRWLRGRSTRPVLPASAGHRRKKPPRSLMGAKPLASMLDHHIFRPRRALQCTSYEDRCLRSEPVAEGLCVMSRLTHRGKDGSRLHSMNSSAWASSMDGISTPRLLSSQQWRTIRAALPVIRAAHQADAGPSQSPRVLESRRCARH